MPEIEHSAMKKTNSSQSNTKKSMDFGETLEDLEERDDLESEMHLTSSDMSKSMVN